MKKKTISLSLMLVLVLLLAACAQQEEPVDEVSQEAPVDEAPVDAYPAEEAPVEAPAEAYPVEEAPEADAPVEAPAEESMEMDMGLAFVDSVSVAEQGDSYVAVVSGSLADGCTQIAGSSQAVEGSAINITLETARPVDMMCTQALVPYTQEIGIDTTGLAEGSYTVTVNGVMASEPVIVGSGENAPLPVEDSADSQIINIVWQWAQLVESDPAAQSVVPNPENYTITLLRDGQAVVKADCNQLQITYTLDGSSLVFNMLGPSTLAYCGEESLDTQFLSHLSSVNSYALEGELLQLTTTNGATMSFNNGGSAPGSIAIDPSQITLDTQGLPYSWTAVIVPMQPYDTSMPPGPQGLPEHIQILFGVTDPSDRQSNDPVMYIIPVKEYAAMYEANDNGSVTNSLMQIAELTYELPDPAPTSGYAVLPSAPYSPVIGPNDFSVQGGRATADEFSAAKNGYRFVGRWAQDANPVTNQNLYYTFQGFTNDGEYLVSFFYPVRSDQLADDPSSYSQEEWDAFYSDPMAQINASAEALNQLSTSDWNPDLAVLDALVGSLQIEGMVASGIQEKQWEWAEDAATGTEIQTIEDPTSYTVYYEDDGTFHFQADCNNGGGSYVVDGGFNGDLSNQAGPLTAAACPEDSRSDTFIDFLSAADSYRLRPGGILLEMLLPDGAGTFVFTEAGTDPVELPEPETGEPSGTVIAEAGANVRLGPGTSFPSIGVAPFGMSGTIIGKSQDGQWWAFDTPESQSLIGWVLESLVEVENVDAVRVLPAPALPDPTPAPNPVPPPPPSIADTSWVVSTLNVNQFPLPGSSLTAAFIGSSQFSANGGCNTYNGSYSVNGNNISIGPLAGTRMACGEELDTQEQVYIAGLQAARTFTINGSQMTLFDGSGQEVVRLIYP